MGKERIVDMEKRDDLDYDEIQDVHLAMLKREREYFEV